MDLKALASAELKMPSLRRTKAKEAAAAVAAPDVAAATALQDPPTERANKQRRKLELGSLGGKKLSRPEAPHFSSPFKRARSTALVGLNIEPGRAVAVRVARHGSEVSVEQAASIVLPGTAVRDGDVADAEALGAALKEMFEKAGLPRRVRVGMAGQRSVMRVLSLPPISDRKELAAAVRFTAEKEMPMPLNVAVTDFQALGEIETPAGPRQRVVFVAAHREPVTKLLEALRKGGISAAGIDLSAFALIRALHRPVEDPEASDCYLYVNVDGLTNIAIAEGTTCLFTRAASVGVESMAAELAARVETSLDDARSRVANVDLAAEPDAESVDAQIVVGDGMREVAVEVRTALDFHRSQQDGGEVSGIILSGGASAIHGFAEQLAEATAMPVEARTVNVSERAVDEVDASHLAIAVGLAVVEAPQ
jgi:type IV pilus assembly protein PilM